MRLLLQTVVLVVALFPSAAWAQPRTDVVTLANGDRITGEILTLYRGRLEFKTDDIGTLNIELDNVVRVESTRQFEIANSDGRRFLGDLRPAADRFVLIVSSDGELSVPILEITSIYPIGASFWAKLDGALDVGFNYTRSSGVAQLTLNSDTTFRRPDFYVELSASGTVTEQADEGGRDDRGQLALSYVRYRGRRWLLGGSVSLETNESLGLLLRYYPSLSHWGRQRLQFDASVKRELWRNFHIALNVYDSFDSAPPNPDAARNDVGLVTSISWTY